MTPDGFRQLIADLTAQLHGRPLNAELDRWLNTEHGPASATYQALRHACIDGVAAGWMCNREHAGIRYGRVIKPADDVHRFSVDVVDMDRIAGGHHVHPTGEIDMLIALADQPKFCGRTSSWSVYPAGSAHVPEVTDGRALVLYLLPEGQIEFTR